MSRARVRGALGAVVAVLLLSSAVAFDMSTVESDEEGVIELRSAVAAGWVLTPKEGKGLVATAMHRGYWQLAEELITHAKTVRGADVTHAVYKSASTIRKQLKLLEEALNAKRRMSKGISPAFEWAQSPDTVFLNVKFAHKVDAPATLGCEATNTTIEGNTFRFVADCKAKRKTFDLKFTALRDFDGEASSWTMASVGRAVFTLRKAKNATWARLMKSHNKPANMHVWWSMKEQYDKENEEFGKVEAKLRRQEFEDKQRARKAQDAGSGTGADDSDEADSADVTAEAATQEAKPVAAVETAPALTAFDMAKAEVEKRYRKMRKGIEEELRASIAEIDKEARAAKKVVIERATKEKKEISDRATARRSEASDAAEARRKELEAAQQAEIEALPGAAAGEAEL